MSIAFSFLPLAMLPVLYALFAKASAYMFRRTQLGWLHSFVFGVLLTLTGIAGAVLHHVAGSPLPIPLASLFSFALLVTIGGWYLGSRARSSDGAFLRFRGGTVLSLIIFGLLTVLTIVCVVLGSLVSLLLHAH